MRVLLVVNVLLVLCSLSVGQTNPQNVPQPPSAELQKFEPFLGKYEVSGDFANLPWAGTLELKRVIKGWYIEQIIRIKSPGIDREFWVLVTWDKNAQKYRLWGFQTLPSQIEGDVRFEDDEMITEWTYTAADGQKATSSNRYKFLGNEELLVTSYRQVGNGLVEKIGTLTGKRTTGPDATVSSSKKDNDRAVSPSEPQPEPQLQSLAKAFEGKWHIEEQYEPDQWPPTGGTGYGQEVWRRGPGAFTFMEEIHDHTPSVEQFGVGFSWWDRTKGLQGLWCINSNPQGCDLQSTLSGFDPKWDGKQLIIHTEFPRDGKNFVWHEVFSDITATSFTQTADIGEKGGPLKRWLTIHATKIAETTELSNELAETDGQTIHESSVEQAVTDAERRWEVALKQFDSDAMQSLLAEDDLQTDFRGVVNDKASWIQGFKQVGANVRSGVTQWEISFDDQKVRVYGDAAIVTGRGTFKGHRKGGPPVNRVIRFTNLWVERRGAWQLVSYQATPIEPQSRSCKR